MHISNPDHWNHAQWRAACDRQLFLFLILLWPFAIHEATQWPWRETLLAAVGLPVITAAVLTVAHGILWVVLPGLWYWLKGE